MTSNLLRYFLGLLFGLLAGLFIVQMGFYLEIGSVEPMIIGANFSIRDYSVILSFVFLGIACAKVFSAREDLEKEKLSAISLKKELEKKNKLLGFAAHAMRTPTSALRWALMELISGSYGSLASDQKRLVEELQNETETLLSLIEDYLDVSNFEVHNLEVLLKKVSISELDEEIKKIIEPLYHRAEAKHVIVKYTSSDVKAYDNLFILADVQRLMRVVENLLENAIDYTNSGGKVHIIAMVSDDNFVLQFSDTGIGISEKDKEKIFSEFFRSINARKLKSTGSGIGLFLARIIVDAHRGKIWFDSEENKGTTFYVSIPLYNPRKTDEFEEFLKRV